MLLKVLYLAAGSVTGGFARYFVSVAVTRAWGTRFPFGTVLINLFGCLLIGFLSSIAEGRLALSANTRLLLIVGFCGAFTTFSTFMMETAHLIRNGDHLHAFLNVAVSVIAGFFLFWLGVILGEAF